MSDADPDQRKTVPGERLVTPPLSINQKTTMSVALVLVIIGGIVSNVSMMFALRGDVALVQRDVSHVVEDTRQIRSSMTKLSQEQRAESTELRDEISTLRGRIDELRSRVRELEK